MLRYFYAWTPLVIVGTIVLLSAPWLALIALTIVSLVALAALASAVVVVPYAFVVAMSRRWHGRSDTSPRTAAVLAPAVRKPNFQGIRVMSTTTTAGGTEAAAVGMRAAPAAAFTNGLAARSLAQPVVHISWGGVNR